jgi:hypothetical protein
MYCESLLRCCRSLKMRMIVLIEDSPIPEKILKRLNLWDPQSTWLGPAR